MTVDARFTERTDDGPGMPVTIRPGSATIVAHVLHARRVHSLEREAFATALDGIDLGPGAIRVHTCHRVEVYQAVRPTDEPRLPALPDGVERLEDADAVRHLVEVACGLDSAVFGEDQILHQLRVTLAERRDGGSIDPVLDRLFQAALRAGRQSRAWFEGSPRSLADVAMELIAQEVGDVHGRTILVVGAGRMGRLAAFAAHRRGARVLVVNRTAERARALAAEVGGEWSSFGADDALGEIAGAIVALAGAWEVGVGDATRIVSAGVPIVDLSSPPSVPMPLQERLGRRYTSVDDVVLGSALAPTDRLRRRIERLVADTGRDYCAWLRARDSVPVIQAVVSSAEQVRRAELEWLLNRLPDLDATERAALEQMSHRLVAALLHAPLDALHADDKGALEHAARNLFGL
jgi:glutamyl-tRNA reductase